MHTLQIKHNRYYTSNSPIATNYASLWSRFLIFRCFVVVWFFIRLFSYHFNCVATQKIERKNNNNYVDLELPINCPIGEIDVR